MEEIQNRVNEASRQVERLEKKVEEIEQFYCSFRKNQHTDVRNNSSRNKDEGRHVMSGQNQHDSKSERMEALISQFGTMFNQARNPNTIRKQMEDKDDSGYKHVQDAHSDVRSVLYNAEKNNDGRSDVHMTAKPVLAEFRDKWCSLLPEIMQEDGRIEEEEGLKRFYHAQMAKDVSRELYEVDMGLNELRELVLQRCRTMSILEKRKLISALTKLSAVDLMRALEIVAQGNPTFEATAEEVELDIDALSESTLWRLKYFIAEKYRAQGNNIISIGNDQNNENKPHKSNSNPKKETGDSLVDAPKKKCKKVGPTV
ncbi:Transcription factor GTE1 [Bienertia sinuspersici]